MNSKVHPRFIHKKTPVHSLERFVCTHLFIYFSYAIFSFHHEIKFELYTENYAAHRWLLRSFVINSMGYVNGQRICIHHSGWCCAKPMPILRTCSKWDERPHYAIRTRTGASNSPTARSTQKLWEFLYFPTFHLGIFCRMLLRSSLTESSMNYFFWS